MHRLLIILADKVWYCLRQKQIYIRQGIAKRCKICCSSVKRQEAGDSSSQVYSCNQQPCVLCCVLWSNGGNWKLYWSISLWVREPVGVASFLVLRGSNFQLSVESDPELLCFSLKLVLRLVQKTRATLSTNQLAALSFAADLIIRVFPRFEQCACFHWVLIG